MDYRILGPLEVHGDRGAIDVPGRKPRAVLAVLLLHANEPVSAERLAMALWGREAPAGAIRTVHVNVSRLRKALGTGDILTTTPAGYRLRVDPGELDADRFERLVDDGRRALERGQVDHAGLVLRQALDLWRGPPLADLAFEPFAQAEIARLEEQHEAALEARVEADLAAGRHAELVGELRRLAAEYPARERLAGQLMLALYRCGRQGDALEAYREARRRLADELGVEPGDELRALQEAILHHDPALAVDRARVELPHELDAATAPPLVGRETELEWLRDRWAEARSGQGRLIALAGTVGMGKSRLAAELATEVHETGGSVLYTSGAGPARAVHEVLERSRAARRPLLLIVDDADQAHADVLAAVRDVAAGSVLVLATASDHEALEGLDPGVVLFLDLDRLGPAAVAKIAALYVPDDATADILPAEWLLGASAGVPQRVHDVASQWARERVGAAAGRAAAGRSQLRSMEDELAGGVVQLQAVREWRAPPEDGEQRVVCPFKGLASFEAADAPYFFGRERLVAELVARLVGAPLLGVVGPSGSGKSSVVRAGLLPALASGVLPGSERWPQRVIRPGEHPLRQLQEAIAAAPSSDRFVLAVDQFEETFTVCRDEQERAAFVAGLARAASGESGGVVVVAVRADFYGRCAEYPELSRLLSSNHVLVGPMQPEELRRAITCPAQRVGLTVEDELTQRIVSDVHDAPGALPLLSTALLELWRRRDGRRLRLAAYQETGGVRGAVARLAEDAYERLDGDQRELARRLLLQLVEVDDEGAAERRRLPLTDVGAGAEPLLDVLADARLVTLSEGAVELGHEALLREWPRLRGWIQDGLEDLRIERSLRAAASEWDRVGRDDGALFRGARLAEAHDWSERVGVSDDLARGFLGASVERERRDRRHRRRRLTFAFGGLAFGLVAIAVFAAIALEQRGEAERERDRATSRALAAEARNNIEIDPALSLQLALWALDTGETPEAEAALREATSAFRQQSVVTADPEDAWTAQLSPDGTRLVTGGSEGRAMLWDAGTHEEIAQWAAGHGELWTSRFSRDGNRIALGFNDGTVAVTDASLGSPQEVARVRGTPSWSVAFVGDGDGVAAGFDDGTVRVFAVDGSDPPQVLEGHEGAVNSVDASADGTRVVSAARDGTVRLWTLADGSFRQLHSGEGWMLDAAFSPDGRVILAVGDDGLVRRWNARTGREGPTTPGGGGLLNTVAFSADGDRFAAGGVDGNVLVWAVPGGPPVASLRGPGAFVYDVGFGRTGDVVVGAFDDGTVRLWDPGRIQFWTVPQATGSIAFDRDGRYIVTPSAIGDVSVWDAATGELVNRLPGSGETITTQVSPAADEVVIADQYSPEVRVWPIDQDTDEVRFRAPGVDGLYAARVDSSGERIAYVDTDGEVAVADLASGREVPLEGGPDGVDVAQFSADGTRLAVTSQSGRGAIWDVESPNRPERWLTGHRDRNHAMHYGDDDRVLTAGNDKTVRVWPARDGPAIVMTGHTQGVSDAAFWTDPGKVLSVSFDGTLRLWNSRTGASLGVLETGTRPLYGMAVSRDGKIAILDADGVVRVSDCDVCGSLEAVESLARKLDPRPLTANERRQYLAALD
jgi:WD40 repeat protein/DNA-binding SARP family transcriptional activator/ABC-type dipeptide/oligopeptide/nickel transport system ATPase subunit